MTVHALVLLASAESMAASNVAVTYSQNHRIIARMTYTGPDGGANSDPMTYWKLISNAPQFASAVKIRADGDGFRTATLKGPVLISVTIRSSINMGLIEVDGLVLERDDPASDRWHLTKAEHQRVIGMVRKIQRSTMTVELLRRYDSLTRSIYFGPPDARAAEPKAHWSLLGSPPTLVLHQRILPDEPGGKTATLTGEIRLRLVVRPHIRIGGNTPYSGRLELDSLRLVRDSESSDHWYVEAEDLQRILGLITTPDE